MDVRRSIQDIIPPARSRPIRPASSQGTSPPPPSPTPPKPMDLNPNRPKGLLAILFVIGGLLLVSSIVLGVISTAFHKAYVTATPKKFIVPVTGTFKAGNAEDSVRYERITAESALSSKVEATGSKKVQDRASGKITVYNAYSTKSERLITNTRFQSKEGKVYRVHSALVVPGYTMKTGVKVPGSIEATIYADEPGESYNVGITDFTIPGLKGTDQFTLMYAKSKTPMSGGFVGDRAIVDDAVRKSAIDSLRADVDRDVRAAIVTKVPPEFIFFDSTISVTYTDTPDRIEGSEAVITVVGTASAPVFDGSSLASTIAGDSVQFDGLMMIDNPQELSVTIADSSSVVAGSDFSFGVSGEAQLVAFLDASALVDALLGKSKSDIPSVTAQFPAIESLQFRVWPFWRSGIPTMRDRVEVSISQ